MEHQTDFNNYMTPTTSNRSVTAQALVSRQAQEVQAAMIVAKNFPRDEFQAFTNIMKACERKNLAMSAVYEYPRGGQKVSGPSIRLAEVLAQQWGNMDFGYIELEQKNGESTVMAYAWDLQTNTRQSKTFAVKHERKARGSVTKLDDPRDIYELIANQASRRVRACILGVIPGDIVDAAVEKCQQAMVSGHNEPLQDRVRKALSIFEQKFSVNKEAVETYIGCNAEAFTEHDYARLVKVFSSLKDGMAKREDYFNIPKPQGASVDVNSDTEAAFKAAQQGGGSANATDQSKLPL